MKITLTDKELRHTLDLSSEEIIALIRYQNPKPSKGEFEIVSPCLLIVGDKKFQVDILNVESQAEVGLESDDILERLRVYESSGEFPSEAKQPKKDVSPFVLTVELPSPLFEALSNNQELIVLFRVRNIPSYVKTDKAKVDFNLEESLKTGYKPSLVIKVDKVKPIADLLKAQISESQFQEVFIEGNSDEFFNNEGRPLDELVGLIGIKRMKEETDVALRTRVKNYLKLRLDQLSKVDDAQLQGLLTEEEEKARIERKLAEAEKRMKKKKQKEKE